MPLTFPVYKWVREAGVVRGALSILRCVSCLVGAVFEARRTLLMKLIIRWLVTSLALLIAAWLVPGIHVDEGGWLVFAGMALILGLVNAIIRPILKLLSCPLIILTLGLFVLVINGLTLWLASAMATRWFGVGFHVDGFWPAFFGALIVSIVSVLLHALMPDAKREG